MKNSGTTLGMALVAILSTAGCSSGESNFLVCETSAECPSGYFCRNQECVFDCQNHADCPDGYHCTSRGECEPGCVPSNGGTEICDGLDNDCDDETDEDFVLNRCGECEPPDDQLLELCGDLLDNDCDSETDEGFEDLGQACDNLGCEGILVCSADWLSLECNARDPAPDDATCDDVDDDCDGETNEDVPPQGCPKFMGICEGVLNHCLEDGSWSGCDYGPDYTEGVDNWCDTNDNDCDGHTDEGAGPTFEAESGEQAADGLDNNCNSYVDEPGGVMVLPRPFAARWIDVYEIGVFENADCTGTQYGVEADDYPPGWPAEGPASVILYACSLPGIKPSGYLSWYRAQRACQAQGKNLCESETWDDSCSLDDEYPYGDVFIPGVCNDGLGGTGQLAETGSFTGCKEQDRIADLSGNLAEWLLDWSSTYPGHARTAGHHFLPQICDLGNQCITVDPDNPAEVEQLKNALDCHVYSRPIKLYPINQARAYLGTRCCIKEL